MANNNDRRTNTYIRLCEKRKLCENIIQYRKKKHNKNIQRHVNAKWKNRRWNPSYSNLVLQHERAQHVAVLVDISLFAIRYNDFNSTWPCGEVDVSRKKYLYIVFAVTYFRVQCPMSSYLYNMENGNAPIIVRLLQNCIDCFDILRYLAHCVNCDEFCPVMCIKAWTFVHKFALEEVEIHLNHCWNNWIFAPAYFVLWHQLIQSKILRIRKKNCLCLISDRHGVFQLTMASEFNMTSRNDGLKAFSPLGFFATIYSTSSSKPNKYLLLRLHVFSLALALFCNVY